MKVLPPVSDPENCRSHKVPGQPPRFFGPFLLHFALLNGS